MVRTLLARVALIVERPSADRLTLENKLHQGLVAVRYRSVTPVEDELVSATSS